MKPLLEKNLFSSSNGESLFIRGSFNQWDGFDYQLRGDDGTGVFRGSFKIDANIGDTLEYKFIIRNAENQVYWERNPNPSNPPNSNRKLIVAENNLVPPITTFDYDEYIKYPVIFNKQKLQQDYIQLRNIVEENHPALYDYTSKKKLDSLFDHSYSQIDSSLTFNEYYKLISVVLSNIGCGHTKLWIPNDYWNIVPKRLFPLKIKFIAQRVFVSDYYSDSADIPIGCEILSINNVPIQKIIRELKSIESADGFNPAFKSKSIEKNFSKKYALYFGYPNSFRIKYIDPNEVMTNEVDLRPVNIETINRQPVRGSELSLKVLEKSNTAILTINTFIYYDQLEMFKSFIDSTFEVIQDKKINNLIIDLRGNDGGDPFCSSYLLSYIEHEAVPYFAKPYGKYAELANPIPVAKNNFKGNLFTLIDGSAFSTTGHFCALLKYHKIGKFVGSETGATFTCTGSVRYINLKNTKLILGTARNQRYSVAVKNMEKTRGVLPDYQVEQSQIDLIEGEDSVIHFVLNLISCKN